MSHEIITLQLGNYSNFIGSHFWNIQESNFVYDTHNVKNLPDINHNVLFREGLNLEHHVTYTPRLILIDLKDSLNSLKVSGTLYENEEHHSSTPAWSGKVDLHESKPSEPSDYIKDIEKGEENVAKTYNMDEQVKYWPDYLRMRFHPRSTLLVDQFLYESSESEPFELYHYGVNVMKDLNFSDSFENRLRAYAEECDYMQGFHLFLDSYNGFGGLTENILSLINEEYSKKTVFSVFSYPYFENQDHDSQMVKLINTAFSIKTLFNEITDSIVVPMSLFDSFLVSKEQKPLKLDSIDYRADLNYHTSAILASLVDCLSIPWRQKSHNTKLADIYDALDICKYKLCSLKSRLPFDIDNKKYLFNYLQENDLNEKLNWFTPLCEQTTKHETSQTFLSQILTCKGFDDNSVKNPRDTFFFKSVVPASEVLDVYCKESYANSISKCYSLQTPLNVSVPYPDIFRLKSEIFSSDKFKQETKTIPLMTSLQMTNKISNILEVIRKNLEKCNIKQYNRYFDCGMEYDDFKDVVEFNTELYYLYSTK